MKIKYLTEFHETALVDRAWKLEGVGEGDERILLERFSSVTTVFQSLSEGSQEVCAYCPQSRTYLWSLVCAILPCSVKNSHLSKALKTRERFLLV